MSSFIRKLWAKLPVHHASFMVKQLVLQGLVFVGGIVMIRNMPPGEYGLYFLFTTLVAVVTILSGGGLFVGFNKLGGPLTGDREKYANIVASLLRLRLRVLVTVVPLLLVVAALVFAKQEVTGGGLALVLAVFAVVAGLGLVGGLWSGALVLARDHDAVQTIHLWVEVLRAGGLVVCALVLPSHEALLGVMLLSGLLSLALLRRRAVRRGMTGGVPERAYEREMLADYWRLLPNSVYYAVQGQVSAFLLAWFGGGNSVASLGAMSRLGRGMEPVMSYARNVVQPKCARTTGYGNFRGLLNRIGLASLALAAVIVLAGVVGADVFVWMLGDGYTGLNREMGIYFALVALNFLSGMAVTVNHAKGWIHYASMGNIPLSILGMVIGAVVFGVDTVHGVLMMGLLSRVPVLCLQLLDLRRGLAAMGVQPEVARNDGATDGVR